jgi:host factor-I protein
MSDRGGVVSGGRVPPLQDTYLAEVKRQAIPVTVYLVNGFQLRGMVRGFDAFTIVLEYEHRYHLIYKHAVSTITPQSSFTGGLDGAPDPSGAARS